MASGRVGVNFSSVVVMEDMETDGLCMVMLEEGEEDMANSTEGKKVLVLGEEVHWYMKIERRWKRGLAYLKTRGRCIVPRSQDFQKVRYLF